MRTWSPTPSRIFIRRGKKPQESSGVGAFLEGNDKISALLPAVKRNIALQKECAGALPALFERCEVMQLNAGMLSISAPNAALATKLKQQLPKLQEYLTQRGWQINAIRIKVQVRRSFEKAAPQKQIALSPPALNALDELGRELPDTPQNASLRDALARLVRRHR